MKSTLTSPIYLILLGLTRLLLDFVLPSTSIAASANWFDDANSVHPLETAATHNSNRLSFGIGSQQTFPVTATAAKGNTRAHSKGTFLPQFFIHKGLLYPFTLGLNLAPTAQTSVTQAGGYLQWTIFEQFAIPAFALRLAYSNLLGHPLVPIKTFGLQSVVSWGYKRFSVYGVLAATRFQAYEPATAKSNPHILYIWERALGIHLQVLPGLTYMVWEKSFGHNHRESSSFKIALEMNI